MSKVKKKKQKILDSQNNNNEGSFKFQLFYLSCTYQEEKITTGSLDDLMIESSISPLPCALLDFLLRYLHYLLAFNVRCPPPPHHSFLCSSPHGERRRPRLS